ncbi:hypothetical protein L1049_007742 [Liquidambar formosana]|uniref:Thioredoxin domain-containing protein n=1 Tax=Liquidambar formosana TaxID=63359 RepID=A0AAP0X449_LIQFO
MADVVSKSNLFRPPCIHRHWISIFPNNWNFNSGVYSSALREFPSLKLKPMSLRSSSLGSDFYGPRIVVEQGKGMPKKGNSKASNSQMSLLIGKAQKWWEKEIQPNMKEVTSAQDLVDSLLNAGDKLVVVDFFSPGCGGCKALHPKICQLAEMNPEVQFLQVNYEEHKSMCYSLNVHVLPFFRFYRGAHGRLCSFSCTNATIKKFKDALAKHKPDRCSLGPTKGLEEKELVALCANKDLSFNYTPKPMEPLLVPAQEEFVIAAAAAHSNSNPPLPLPSTTSRSTTTQEKTLVTAGR